MSKVLSSIILGSCIFVGFAFHNVYVPSSRHTGSLNVDGVAEQEVKADLFGWEFSVTTIGDTENDVKEQHKKASSEISALFEKAGMIKGEDYHIRPKHLSRSKTDAGKDVYQIGQSFSILTQKISAAEQIYKSTEKLVEAGVSIENGQSPRYQIKDSKDLEKLLCIKAIANAEEKVRQLEKSTGIQTIGAPTIYWYGVDFRDANAADGRSYYWCGGEHSDQIASVKVSYSYHTIK
ncbi:MAG: SIMPL domain-containing protein [Holosporales bacterium]|jgi:hypothetical protein|nr:SIMPL domain-containing protein [Holosporales bacterium]